MRKNNWKKGWRRRRSRKETCLFLSFMHSEVLYSTVLEFDART
jgi:hypothetical protein